MSQRARYIWHSSWSALHSVGCTLVENNSWPNAPLTVPIIGLKELPEADTPLPHVHIQFAHCYKQQAGWSSVLARFYKGGGTLYDLEFLEDAQGRRVAAFGYHAGFAGAAAGALAIAAQKKGQSLGSLEPFANQAAMVDSIKAALGGSGKGVKALVIGALGRCGRGAVDLFREIGLDECVPRLKARCVTLIGVYYQGRHPEMGYGRDSKGWAFRRNPGCGRFCELHLLEFANTAFCDAGATPECGGPTPAVNRGGCELRYDESVQSAPDIQREHDVLEANGGSRCRVSSSARRGRARADGCTGRGRERSL